MHTSISFTSHSHHGDNPSYKDQKKWKKKSHTPTNLLHALSTSQRELEFRLEEEVKAFLQANFDENPLKYWDQDKSYADVQLKDAHSIVRVKPMGYNQADEIEFKIQLRELKDKQLAFKSIKDNKSPHSSLAFMVDNHFEQK